MTVAILVACWFLFVLPCFLFAAVFFGAWLYAKGSNGQTPTLVAPRFGVSRSRGNGKAADRLESDRLPAV